MSVRIPTVGAHARCVRAAIDGLASIEECRWLGRQAAGFITAAGGVVIDHLFVHGDAEQGLRLWACREDLATFAAGMRATLRCLVDRPGRLPLTSRPFRQSPRVDVNVALAPPLDPLSSVILELFDRGFDLQHLAGRVLALSSHAVTMDADPDDPLIGVARRLLAMRPDRVSSSAHLIVVLGKLGLSQPSLLVQRFGAVREPVLMERLGS
jgi:hypothetical protein